MKSNIKALLAAAGVTAFAFSPANAFEGGVQWQQKPGIFIGASAGVPPPGIYMFDQVFTYQTNLAGPLTNVVGSHNGVQAALFAAHGFTGVSDVFSGERNFFVAYDEGLTTRVASAGGKGPLLAVGRDDGRVGVLNLAATANEKVRNTPTGAPVTALALSTDGGRVAWGDESGGAGVAGLPAMM